MRVICISKLLIITNIFNTLPFHLLKLKEIEHKDDNIFETELYKLFQLIFQFHFVFSFCDQLMRLFIFAYGV